MKTRLTIRGFTLIDLLVTMAVIAILIAVLAPATIQGRNHAKMVSCISNLQQLGRATMLYSQDWSDRLPKLGGRPFAGRGTVGEWSDGTSATFARAALLKYASSGKVFQCPNDMGSPAYGFDHGGGSVFSRTGSSYLPWATVRAGKYGISLNGERVSGRLKSMAAILFMDYGAGWHGRLERHGIGVEAVSRANAVFADGHTKTISSLMVDTGNGAYMWTASSSGAESELLTLGGSSDSGDVELTSTNLTDFPGVGPPPKIRLKLSGIVMVGDMPYEVDREFVFDEDTELNAALRHVTYWADSLMAY